MHVYINVYINSIPSSLFLSCFQYVVTLFCGQMVPASLLHLIVTLFHDIVRTFHESLSHEQKWGCYSCVHFVLSAISQKKTCFILSFTLKLWYEQSDHKMEQSDHAMMQGLSQLYCKGTNRQQQDRRYFMTLPFSYPIKRLSVAQEKKKI